MCKYKQSLDFKLSTFHLELYLFHPFFFVCVFVMRLLSRYCSYSSSSSSSFPSFLRLFTLTYEAEAEGSGELLIASSSLSSSLAQSAQTVVPFLLLPLCQSPLSLSLCLVRIYKVPSFCPSFKHRRILSTEMEAERRHWLSSYFLSFVLSSSDFSFPHSLASHHITESNTHVACSPLQPPSPLLPPHY
jgi:hypothetical protein